MQTPSERHAYPAHWEADVVLRDGGTARIKPITADDADRLVGFYEQVSDESKYYRFFAPYPRLSANDVRRFTHHDFVDRVGLAAVVGGEFIATVRYDRIDDQGRPAPGPPPPSSAAPPAGQRPRSENLGGPPVASSEAVSAAGAPLDGAPLDTAEVAFLVQDAHQGRGVASALLEHIAAVARERGIRRFAAEVLPANNKMIKVFTDAGYQQRRSYEDGVVRLELDLAPTEASRAVQLAREQRAEARSVQRLLRPRSVAVIGASRDPGGVGRSVLANLRRAGFTGRLYAVNEAFPEEWTTLDGVPAHRSLAEITTIAESAETAESAEPVDLAVVVVPAARVPGVVDACGAQGVQGLVVLSAGYAETGDAGRARQRALVRQARSYGMRVIGPNAFGILNTSPEVLLNASLAPRLPRAGRIGLFTQSGAIGIALLARLHRRGGGVPPGAGGTWAAADADADADVGGGGGEGEDAGVAGGGGAETAGVAGISTVVSAGNRADVSGNDVLQYWYEDPDTDVALMYLETIGNPRKFTRLARRTAAVKPLVVVLGARHSDGIQDTTYGGGGDVGAARGGGDLGGAHGAHALLGHTVPSTRLPHATVAALLRQAGVLRVSTITELVDVGLQLAAQPLPAGPRVSILGNSASLGLLAYDACLSAGLQPLRPRDLTTAATPGDFATALDAALAGPGCDAVIVTVIPSLHQAYHPGPAGASTSRTRNAREASPAGGPATDEALAAALRAAAARYPWKPVSVVHVELGGLAAALSAAGSTGPGAPEPGPPGSGTGGSATSVTGPAEHGSPEPAAVEPGSPEPAPVEPGSPVSGPVEPGSSVSGPVEPGPLEPGRVDPGQPERRPEAAPEPRIPAFPAAERAVRALAEAVVYAQWRREAAEPGTVLHDDAIDEKGAARLIEALLEPATGDPRGVTLAASDARDLLGAYGIAVRTALPAPDPDGAVRAAAALGYPVALKTTAPHLRHRADLGGVRLDVAGEGQLRRAYAELTDSLGPPGELLPVVQAMVPRGVDTVVRAVIDPTAGAVLSFGLAGVASELLDDMAHRLIPVTDREARSLVRSIRAAPLLFGWRGSAPVDSGALEELLLRVSRLVDDHPEVVAVALEPVVVATQGVSVLSASVRLAPRPARTDLGPRAMPAY